MIPPGGVPGHVSHRPAARSRRASASSRGSSLVAAQRLVGGDVGWQRSRPQGETLDGRPASSAICACVANQVPPRSAIAVTTLSSIRAR